MNAKVSSAAGVFLALMMTGGGAHAFGNACKNVNFSVNNGFTVNNSPHTLTVERLQLYSASEGRWLTESIPNVLVPAGVQDFPIRRGETVEYAENDRITQISVRFHYVFDNDPDGPGQTFTRTFTDRSIDDPVCVADRWYRVDIALNVNHHP